ncbi:hypothetical protein [Acetobacter orleanensis]|uniref:Uncharacterized protein n=1 Tax=Acetobacter orleanensis TaxID=104099 RepID=A0A4Y3TNG7_9PROT|nr:hypothetical protein [Acetobacter orleanensis]KXV62566.1 hypothetical protein AD949_10685 [Acetobacter orleanensis]PCD79987.1 hypothetical protein CO710_03785 [Acetobacter orleanensis]GAN68300.1 hypothetical protein Abol_015_139 [Acetobacter orleanensis JCM 7639]GBR27584.1 hypothetical protein AA0473_1478 [Acetobacter orleanensis NRIC 0473]GEB83886.1 hypothetical protein AOR01nite_23630 [Acetobacter orleanensis]
MSNSTNWPNPERPGVPLFPEQDGKHVIDVDPEGQKTELVYYWIAKHQVWIEYEYQGPDDALEGYDLIGWVYVGPCFTPTQISEMLAGERERCLAAITEHGKRAELCWNGSTSDEEKQYWRGALNTFEACSDEIRNLGAAS